MPRPDLRAAAGTLAAVVGIPVALALATDVPHEESGRTVAAAIAGDGHLAIRPISGKQYLDAYLDMVGVATACDGLTTFAGRKIRKGGHFTSAQCTAELERQLTDTATHVTGCTPGIALSADPAIERRREGPRFSSVSLAHNVGWPAFCASTAHRRFDAGDYAGGCSASTWFNRAGGHKVRGLAARRAREAKVCRGGLTQLHLRMGGK